MKGTSTIWFRADPAMFGSVRRYVAQFVVLSGGSEEDAVELELATGEVLANAYVRAYRNTHGPLQLDLTCDGQQIMIEVHDEADRAAGRMSIPARLPEANEHHGLYLVGQLSDRVDVVCPGGGRPGTTIRLVKHVDKLHRLERILGLR